MSLPRIASYDLLFPIARGGMATVFLALAQGAAGFERRVAIKVVHPHLTDDFGPDELLQEARVAGRIRHPNVVPVIDVGQNDDGLFLVMEYVEGTTLSVVLREAARAGEPLPLAVALRIVSDALCGLHAAHELRNDDGAPLALVHRDFSPQNILLGVDGAARLTDFGIAKAKWHAQTTHTGLVKGKDGYMSPEQLRGLPVDRRCDIWAAGVVVWETIACQRLFGGQPTAEGVLERLSSGTVPLLHHARQGVPEAVGRAVARALHPDVERRSADAEALRQALLDGFAPAVLPADLGEVAAWVKRAAAPRLAKLEDRLRALRAERTRPAMPAARPSADPELLHPPLAATPITPTRGRPWRVLAVASLLAATAGAVALAMRPAVPGNADGPPTEDADSAPARPATPATEQPTAAAAQASADGPSSSTAPASVASITLHADAPIARVLIGSRSVELATSRPIVTVELSAQERGKTLRAVAADGRSADVELRTITGTEVELHFGKPGTSTATGRSHGTRPSSSAILPSPYR